MVQVYRDDSSEKGLGERPRLAHPVDFRLVFRINGRSPVTMWKPVAPEGYVALGTIVQGAPLMPDTSEVLCLRADLAASTRFFDSPIWRWDPPALQASLLPSNSPVYRNISHPHAPLCVICSLHGTGGWA